MKEALIIFARNPVAGKVKTRIATTAGDEEAMKIYLELLQHTQAITRPLQRKKYVFYADEIIADDNWNAEDFEKYKQEGGDLGERMQLAFERIFREGYGKVCIIGSDCPELNAVIIDEAFALLDGHEVVLGPATDGGYYLLGMKTNSPELFSDIQWSTASVAGETLSRCRKAKLRYSLLTELNDIDNEADWTRHKQRVNAC